MNLPTTSIVHNWRGYESKNGLYPIHLRIAINRVQKYDMISVPLKISKEQWVESKMLGHSKEETTKTYYKMDINKVIGGTNHVNFEKIGI
jgi:Arm DNA-binding domain